MLLTLRERASVLLRRVFELDARSLLRITGHAPFQLRPPSRSLPFWTYPSLLRSATTCSLSSPPKCCLPALSPLQLTYASPYSTHSRTDEDRVQLLRDLNTIRGGPLSAGGAGSGAAALAVTKPALHQRIWDYISGKHACKERCQSCPVSTSCLQRRALLRPLPVFLWILFGAAVALPFLLGRNMDFFIELYAKLNGEEELVEVEEKHVQRLRGILRRVGVEHADKVKIYQTRELGPTAVGFNNTRLGGAVFIPENLLNLHEDTDAQSPSTDDASRKQKWITIHDTESGELLAHFPLSELTTERQRLVLEQTGTLLPHARQIDWVLGHEGVHLSQNHAVRSALIGGAGLVWSHLLLKVYNQMARHITVRQWQKERQALRRSGPLIGKNYRFPQVRGLAAHSLVCLSAVGATTFYLSRAMEKEADVLSAIRLGCVDDAIELTERKIEQNLVMRNEGHTLNYTRQGNDRFEFEHPPLTTQLSYLRQLSATGSDPVKPEDTDKKDKPVTP